MKEKLSKLPSSPGVYLMLNNSGDVLYVGKAKSLLQRLRSYFTHSPSLDMRKSMMMNEVKDFDYIVTDNELEALVLEANLIKRYKPKYNVILRDDKNYPYIKLTIKDEWPCLETVRRPASDGSLYFGPYIPVSSMWEVIAFIRRNFPLRHCKKSLTKPERPCIQNQMGRCLAPCTGELDKNQYREVVEDVKMFLKGEQKTLISKLTERMYQYSHEERFEEAAHVRDKIRAIEKSWQNQRVVDPALGDLDIIARYREGDEAAVTIFFLRNGTVIGKKNFFFTKLTGIDDTGLIKTFMEQFYTNNVIPPKEIIVPLEIDSSVIASWLTQKKEADVKILFPKWGKKRELLELARENAAVSFKREKEETVNESLIELRKVLGFKKVPRRIEAVDISNISGSDPVGSIVVWEDKAFCKKDYRRFKIKTVSGIDDFAMIAEVVFRHFKRIKEEEGRFPDVLLIDGGKGQLESVQKIIEELSFPGELIALAKKRKDRFERVFLPGQKKALTLEPDKVSTHLLQRIRDEAHRFAVTFHRKLRSKSLLSSPIENIPGIGKARRLSLLKKFNSIQAIRNASIDEIASVPGITKKTAEKLKQALT
jgi:excinuclease ABC subunit C